MKSYTDLEQSKTLEKILPLESADGWWTALNWQETEYYIEVKQDGIDKPKKCIPCWSLAALLAVLDFPSLTQNKEDEWEVCIPNHKSDGYIEVLADNPVDACVAMIEKLHEQKLL